MPLILLVWIFTLAPLALQGDEIRLIKAGDSWRYFKGRTDPGPNWKGLGFADGPWSEGPSGFGSYSEAHILRDYGISHSTVYFRKNFRVSNPCSIRWLVLRIDYAHGFVAYLNGREVARRGVFGAENETVPVDARALYHRNGATEEIDLSGSIFLLNEGENLLAIQLLGNEADRYTAVLIPELLANFTRGPFLQSTTTTSTKVAWKTFYPSRGMVEYGVEQQAVQRVFSEPNQTNHLAILTGLLPGTVYFYRVGVEIDRAEAWSEWRTFRTFTDGGPVSFSILGDSGVGSVRQYEIAGQMLQKPADLVMHLGDVVYPGFTHQAADFRCLSVYAEQMRQVPFFFAFGNHDMYSDRTSMLETFYLPTNKVTGTEHYYSFDHGFVHFAVLWTDLQQGSDYRPGSPQYMWLEDDLRQSTKPWKFIFFHHVIRSSSYHHFDDYDRNGVLDEIQLQDSLGALARRHGVQIIFTGHDHCFERLAPVEGPMTFVSGGGGAGLYWLNWLQPASVQFHLRNHFLNVQVDEKEAFVQAIDQAGRVFDSVHVRNAFPEKQVYTATWHTPLIEPPGPGYSDGNVLGQTFDFHGTPAGCLPGLNSSVGRLFVNNDAEFAYFGFDEVMLQPGEELFLFIANPEYPGVSSMHDIGNGSYDPSGEGVDGLDFMSNLLFQNFGPSIGVVLGDEYGDGPSRDFLRMNIPIRTGQGAFRLAQGLPQVQGQKLQQYHRSPQDAPFLYEQSANFIELAIPLSSLNLKPGDILQVASVVGLNGVNTDPLFQSRQMDSGGIAANVTLKDNVMTIEPLEFKLASGPEEDLDQDGLGTSEELRRGTDPSKTDTDNDGLPDGWEVQWQLDPKSASDINGPYSDPDGDFFTNQAEYLAGTSPHNPGSRFVANAARENGQIRISWAAAPGKRYRLQYTDAPGTSFHDVPDPVFPKTATGYEESYIINPALSLPSSAYFRIQILP